MYRFETVSVLVKSYMYILAGMLLTTTLVFIFVSLPEKRILHTGNTRLIFTTTPLALEYKNCRANQEWQWRRALFTTVK